MNLTHQAEQLHEQVVELIKKYQFRDRGATCCYGISVSQCYVLETLHRNGSLSMQELAEKMHLAPSTVTRVVGQLVKAGYARRREGRADRRRREVALTAEGELLTRKLWDHVLDSERQILANFPGDQRETLIQFLRQLNSAVDQWKACCADEPLVRLDTKNIN